LYKHDEDFRELYEQFLEKSKGMCLIKNKYLFNGTGLCFHKCGTREVPIKEDHIGALAGPYGDNKMNPCLKSITTIHV